MEIKFWAPHAVDASSRRRGGSRRSTQYLSGYPNSLVDSSRRFAFFGLSSLLAPPEKSTNDQVKQLVELSSSVALTVAPAVRRIAAASKVERDAEKASVKAARRVKQLQKPRRLRQTNGPAKLQTAQVDACVVIKVPSIHVEVVP